MARLLRLCDCRAVEQRHNARRHDGTAEDCEKEEAHSVPLSEPNKEYRARQTG